MKLFLQSASPEIRPRQTQEPGFPTHLRTDGNLSKSNCIRSGKWEVRDKYEEAESSGIDELICESGQRGKEPGF